MLVDVTSFSPVLYILGNDVRVGVTTDDVITDDVVVDDVTTRVATAGGFLGDSGGVIPPIPTSSLDLFSKE